MSEADLGGKGGRGLALLSCLWGNFVGVLGSYSLGMSGVGLHLGSEWTRTYENFWICKILFCSYHKVSLSQVL